MLRSIGIGKQSGVSVESVMGRERRLRWEGFAEKKVLSLEWKNEGVGDEIQI